MAESYLRYGEPRYSAMVPPPVPAKRPRSDYPDTAGGAEYFGYYRDEPRRASRDTEFIGSFYDSYLQNGISSGAGEPGRSLSGGMAGYPAEDIHMFDARGRGRLSVGYVEEKPGKSLPPDASNTLFVEGLPADCTRREVSHVFRPFVGFKEVRLVNKESRYPGGDHLVLCFVDFDTPGQAGLALDALQGYKFDEHNRESSELRLQFARFTGPRSGGPRSGVGPRGRHY